MPCYRQQVLVLAQAEMPQLRENPATTPIVADALLQATRNGRHSGPQWDATATSKSCYHTHGCRRLASSSMLVVSLTQPLLLQESTATTSLFADALLQAARNGSGRSRDVPAIRKSCYRIHGCWRPCYRQPVLYCPWLSCKQSSWSCHKNPCCRLQLKQTTTFFNNSKSKRFLLYPWL